MFSLKNKGILMELKLVVIAIEIYVFFDVFYFWVVGFNGEWKITTKGTSKIVTVF